MTRVAIVGLALVGTACGSTRDPSRDEAVSPEDVEPLVREVVKGLWLQDTPSIVARAGTSEVFDAAFECTSTDERTAREADLRAAIAAALEAVDDRELALVSVDEVRREPTLSLARGERLGTCIARTDLDAFTAKVTLRLSPRDRQGEKVAVELGLVRVDGRIYLARMPKLPREQGSAGGMVAKVEDFARRMCRCTDRQCADGVNDDYVAWGTATARDAQRGRQARPTPDQVKRIAEVATRYTECYTKLAMAGLDP